MDATTLTEHRTTPEHRAATTDTRRWIQTDTLYRAECTCGWRSRPHLYVWDASSELDTHIRDARTSQPPGENAGPNLNHNPDLPKLLRALASGTDAQAHGHDMILIAAADELDFWRINHAAGTWKRS